MTLVDTDILIDAGRGVPEAIACLKDIRANSTLIISIVTQMELMVGCRNKSKLRKRLAELDRRIVEYDHRLEHLATQNEAAHRLMQVEGVGPITATAIVVTIGEGHAFQHGRQFAAWLGVVPKQPSTGGQTVLGRSTKHGNV